MMKNETGVSEAEVHKEHIKKRTAGYNVWSVLTLEQNNDLEMNLELGY